MGPVGWCTWIRSPHNAHGSIGALTGHVRCTSLRCEAVGHFRSAGRTCSRMLSNPMGYTLLADLRGECLACNPGSRCAAIRKAWFYRGVSSCRRTPSQAALPTLRLHLLPPHLLCRQTYIPGSPLDPLTPKFSCTHHLIHNACHTCTEVFGHRCPHRWSWPCWVCTLPVWKSSWALMLTFRQIHGRHMAQHLQRSEGSFG